MSEPVNAIDFMELLEQFVSQDKQCSDGCNYCKYQKACEKFEELEDQIIKIFEE